MTRFFAILGACFCVAMMLVASATENVRGDFDREMILIHAASLFIFAFSLVFYCGFVALHSVSRVESGTDRMGWIILTVGCNVFGSLFYYLTKYQDFRSHGLGGLPRSRLLGQLRVKIGDRRRSSCPSMCSLLQSVVHSKLALAGPFVFDEPP